MLGIPRFPRVVPMGSHRYNPVLSKATDCSANDSMGLLPAPNLTLLTEGAIFKGRSVSLQCAAPSIYQESTFHLQIRDDGKLVETKEAPKSMHSVTFTIAEFTVPGNYVCRYQQLVSTTCGISKSSNILHLTLSAVPDFTTSPPGPTKAGGKIKSFIKYPDEFYPR
ncbi:HIDE1 isoform X1 [Pelobates cultripes]|uniref:HIDE1 isoform X1 n=1 Tax=Pelobates cultripes TaxID=61616 RepID=A0AAD1RJY8_PELCU|nr:HIDE1 isoform X1 [Pelobates cultripes]